MELGDRLKGLVELTGEVHAQKAMEILGCEFADLEAAAEEANLHFDAYIRKLGVPKSIIKRGLYRGPIALPTNVYKERILVYLKKEKRPVGYSKEIVPNVTGAVYKLREALDELVEKDKRVEEVDGGLNERGVQIIFYQLVGAKPEEKKEEQEPMPEQPEPERRERFSITAVSRQEYKQRILDYMKRANRPVCYSTDILPAHIGSGNELKPALDELVDKDKLVKKICIGKSEKGVLLYRYILTSAKQPMEPAEQPEQPALEEPEALEPLPEQPIKPELDEYEQRVCDKLREEGKPLTRRELYDFIDGGDLEIGWAITSLAKKEILTGEEVPTGGRPKMRYSLSEVTPVEKKARVADSNYRNAILTLFEGSSIPRSVPQLVEELHNPDISKIKIAAKELEDDGELNSFVENGIEYYRLSEMV